MSSGGEFGFIANALAPLSVDHPGAFGLTDDGATLAPTPGCELVITADALVEGRHFLAGTAADLVARKALRTNLSDLAAMGAKARWYMTSIVWPRGRFDSLQAGFVEGLRRDQAQFGVTLIGGDTTLADAPWTLAVTAIGELPLGTSVRRSGARPGDHLVVTGTIGDAGLGLEALQGRLSLPTDDLRFLEDRHLLPRPRLELVALLRAHANAAIDVSDGLVADAGHIAAASGLGLVVNLEALPRSPAAARWIEGQADEATALGFLASCGDDYELACAVQDSSLDLFLNEAEKLGVSACVVGRFRQQPDVQVYLRGESLTMTEAGFTHF